MKTHWPIYLASGLVVVLIRAFVMTELWRWFVTPLGMVELTLSQAVGLLFLLAFLKGGHQPATERRGTVAQELLESAAHSLFAWLLGAIAMFAGVWL